MRQLMPSSVSPLEEEMARVTESLEDIETEVIATIWNADECPASLLPVLASALSVDIWDEAWPEDRKRRAVREAPHYHTIKGTDESIAMILALLGCRASRTEWWETSPMGRRGTFHVRAFVNERLYPGAPLVTPELFTKVLAAVRRAKPKSRSFTADIAVAVLGSTGVAAALQSLSVMWLSGSVGTTLELGSRLGATTVGQTVGVALLTGSAEHPAVASGEVGAVCTGQSLAIAGIRMEATVS